MWPSLKPPDCLLHTPANLAAALSLDIPRLRWLAFHSDVVTRSHYVRFTIPKRTGGERILSAPHVALKAVQRWILAEGAVEVAV